ncbi:hypothetical protein [uncultured Nocardioides sp.]|uniref:hypothetical protein n=1 Tax=uncultured Nocardioides sp. TaxID=198441 RepID=UPI0026150613|nr:hypothetical protein [uncultured Nocardioides sp.]
MTRPRSRPHVRLDTRRRTAPGLAALTGLALVATPFLPAQAADSPDRAEAAAAPALLVTGEENVVLPADEGGLPRSVGFGTFGRSAVGPDGELYAIKPFTESGASAGLYRVGSSDWPVEVESGIRLFGLASDADGLVYAQSYCGGEIDTEWRTRLLRYDPETDTQVQVADDLPHLSGIALEPDGDVVGVEQVVSSCGQEDSGIVTSQRLLRITPEGDVETLASNLQAPSDVAVAPDGSLLVTSRDWTEPGDEAEGVGRGALLRVPAAGGQPSVVARVSRPGGLDVSPDGAVWTAGSVLDEGSSQTRGVVQGVAPDGTVSERFSVEDQDLWDVSTLGEAPVLSATVSSDRGRNAAGWYRTPATVTFTCAEGSTPLAGDCPAPVRVDNADRTLRRTITATGDGGSDSVSVRVRVDTTKPTLRTRLVGEAPYAPSARPVRCSATDGLSGVAGDCTVSYGAVRTRANGSRFRTWTASVRDVAGNRTTTTGTFAVRR